MKKTASIIITFFALCYTALGQNVGIGTNTPATKLEVSCGCTDVLKVTSTTSGAGNYSFIDFVTYSGGAYVNARIGSLDMGSNNASLVFQTGNPGSASTITTERMRITNTGNVGIGTTTPSSLLSVGSTSQFQVSSSGAIAAATGITSSGAIQFSGLVGSSSGSLVAASSTGVLSIAGTSTSLPLSGGTGITIGSGNTINSYWTLSGSNLINNNSGGVSVSAGSTQAVITANGTNNPEIVLQNSGNTKLEIGVSNSSNAYISNSAANDVTIRQTGGQKILFSTSSSGSTNDLTLTGGSVGIGTTTPAGQLANSSINPIAYDGNGGNSNSLQWTTASGGYVASFYHSGTCTYCNGVEIKLNSGSAGRLLDLSVGSASSWNGSTPASTEVMVAMASGNVGIGTGAPASLLSVGSSSQFQVDGSGDITTSGTASIANWASQSIGANGYARVGSLLIQWGSGSYSSNGSVTVTFPTAFSNLYSVTATVDAGANTGSGANIGCKVLSTGTTSFQYAGTAAFSSDGVSKVRWIAIGN